MRTINVLQDPKNPALIENRGKAAPRQAVILSRKQELSLQLNQLGDTVLLVFSLWAAHTLQLYLGQFGGIMQSAPSAAFLWLIVPIVALGPLLLESHGYYNLALQKSVLKSLWEISEALLCLGGLVAGCALFFRLNINSGFLLILFSVISAGILLIKARIVLAYFKSRVRTGQHREKVILASSAQPEEMPAEQLAEIDIVEWIDIRRQPVSDLVDAIHRHSVGRVIFPTADTTELRQLKEAIAVCEIEGVEAWLMVDFIQTSIARPAFDVLDAQPVLVLRSAPEASWSLVLKRVIDLIASGIGLLFLSPLLLIVAIAIKLTSPGPVFFTQLRGGQHGRPFRMYKFRSMYADAAKRRQELAAHNELNGPVFKIANDPRITPLGRWLRHYSIDELPQLINVFLGQMSLVGPRPIAVYEIKKFPDPAQRRRMSVKPGLTCLWQVNGRSRVTDFETWVGLDLEYIDNFSLWLDLKILLQTIPAVLLGRGAM
jgi:exopolysaccharide biosynthesis polyprenyl glycosylphosphotransferase